MNKQKLLTIADIIENNPDHFHMSQFITSGEMVIDKVNGEVCVNTSRCGTSACVAGFAVALETGSITRERWATIGIQARNSLELTEDQAQYLFFRAVNPEYQCHTEDDVDEIYIIDRRSYDSAKDYAFAAAHKIREFVEIDGDVEVLKSQGRF